jgi:hypothetical protein
MAALTMQIIVMVGRDDERVRAQGGAVGSRAIYDMLFNYLLYHN